MDTAAAHAGIPRIEEKCDEIVQSRFTPHPFGARVSPDNIDRVLRGLLSLSQAFPYIQAGSLKDLVLDAIAHNEDIGEDIELTSVVATFIAWYETGGHKIVADQGVQSLDEVLDTNDIFHSNLLKKDIKTILGRELVPDYSGETRDYLLWLGEALADRNPIMRVAAMVAFETHADPMIEGLARSLSTLFNVETQELPYFLCHHCHLREGALDHAFHVKLKPKLFKMLRVDEHPEAYLRAFEDCYAKNQSWCEKLAA